MKMNVIEAGGMLSTLSARGMGKRPSHLPGVNNLWGIA